MKALFIPILALTIGGPCEKPLIVVKDNLTIITTSNESEALSGIKAAAYHRSTIEYNGKLIAMFMSGREDSTVVYMLEVTK